MGDEYYLKSPKDQKFHKFLSVAMGAFGLNTETWHWFEVPDYKIYHFQRYVTIIFAPVCTFSQILYLILNYSKHDFTSLAVIFSIMPVACTVVVKSQSAQTACYKAVMRAFMDKIHLHNYITNDEQNHRNKFIAEKLIQAEKYTRGTFFFLTILISISYCAWNIVPIIHNVQHNTSKDNITVRLELFVHMWLPFDYGFHFYGYLSMLVIGAYAGLSGIIVIVLFDTNNLAFIFHLVGHIEIIKYDLRTAFTKNLTEKEMKQKLVDITNYYIFVTSAKGDIEKAFGLNVASVYLQNLVQGGLMMFMIMTNGRSLEVILTYGLMIPIFMGILVALSLVLENIRIQAEDIPDFVYFLPWESMSISNQKILLNILVQVQPIMEFTAIFEIKTGVQPAISIIKTAFSYYLMIKARTE